MLAESEAKDGEVELLLLRVAVLGSDADEAAGVLGTSATTFGEEGIGTVAGSEKRLCAAGYRTASSLHLAGASPTTGAA